MQKQVTIRNSLGIHARPANALIAKAGQYPCEVVIQHGSKSAKAKSMIGVLKLGLQMGDIVTVDATGEKAEEALAAIAELLESVYD